MRHYKNANGRVAITTSVTLFSKWGIGYKDTKSRESGKGRVTSKKSGKRTNSGLAQMQIYDPRAYVRRDRSQAYKNCPYFHY